MKVLAGLGNPGASYAGNRHNIGFMAMDEIARAHNAPPFRAKHGGEMTEIRTGSDKLVLFKPQSYMNRSGQPIGALLRWLKLGVDDLIVFHDELDLAPGKLRIKRGGGHAGHNGLRSIHGHLGPEYGRVRLGIGHPGDKALVAHYVLHDFARADQDWLGPMLAAMAEAAPLLARDDLEGFQNRVAALRQPKRDKQDKRDERVTKPAATSQPARPHAKSAEPSSTEPSSPEPRSPLEKLLERFRKT